MPRQGRGFIFKPVVVKTTNNVNYITVNQVSETDATQGPTLAIKTRVLLRPIETQFAQPIVPLKTLATGQVSESDLSQQVTKSKTLTIGQPSETDSSLDVGLSKSIGQASEADLAQSINPIKSVVLGQPEEFDLSQAVTHIGDKTIPITEVNETDLAQTISPALIRFVGQTSETDLSQAITRTRLIVVGQAFEDDTASFVIRLKTTTIGQPSEIDSSQGVVHPTITVSVGQVVETDVVFGVVIPKVRGVNTAFETDTSQATVIRFLLPPGKKKTAVGASVWKFELVRASDMKRLCELKMAKQRVLTLGLNKAGSFQFTVPLEDEDTYRIEEGTTGVTILKSGNIVWSGIVWTVSEQTPNDVSVGCVGWLQTLEKRVSKFGWGTPDLVYSGTDAGAIALDLLTRSNADNTVGPNYVFPGSAELSQSRDRTYAPYVNILSEINSLSEIESGFDMEVHPASRRLVVSDSSSYRTLPNLRFDYRANVQSVARSSDASRMCNRMSAYNADSVATVNDPQSQSIYGTFEEAVSLSDVKDHSILEAYAAAEVAVRAYPLRITTFLPRPFSTQNPNDPRIFEDFFVGDAGYLSVNKGRLKIDKQKVRVFGASVTFNDNGTESITSVQTTAS